MGTLVASLPLTLADLPDLHAMAWYLPFLIFLARICDVSIGTIRTILVIGGHLYISAALGFIEVLIWVLAVGGVIMHLDNVFALLGYAGGFAVGVMVGMAIENRIALGYRLVRAISADMNINLCEQLRDRGFRVTRVDGRGRSGPVEIAFMIVKRRDVPKLRVDLTDIAPNAFVSVGQVDQPGAASSSQESRFSRFSWLRGLGMRK